MVEIGRNVSSAQVFTTSENGLEEIEFFQKVFSFWTRVLKIKRQQSFYWMSDASKLQSLVLKKLCLAVQ